MRCGPAIALLGSAFLALTVPALGTAGTADDPLGVWNRDDGRGGNRVRAPFRFPSGSG